MGGDNRGRVVFYAQFSQQQPETLYYKAKSNGRQAGTQPGKKCALVGQVICDPLAWAIMLCGRFLLPGCTGDILFLSHIDKLLQ